MVLTAEPAADAPSPTGLSAAEAAERLRRDGPNVLPEVRGPAAWRKFARQLTHFFAVMLWIAGLLALVAGLASLGVAIFAVIVANAAFAFWQEHRAERAASSLRDLLPHRATVVRDGAPIEIEAADVVVGDLVVLSAGDRIPADVTVAEAHQLLVDSSTLTGESVPNPADVGDSAFSGTFVVEGEGQAVVAATGAGTRLATIAALTHGAHRPTSPLASELHRLVRVIATVAVLVGVSFFVVSLLVGSAVSESVVFGIGVTVALVPEGLLPTVTMALAVGAQRMAREHALVRRLESVETLGSTTFICTDKTGTLTANEMEVVEAWTPDGVATIRGEGYTPTGRVAVDADATEALSVLAVTARRCSGGFVVQDGDVWRPRGDPMEAAIDAFARRVGVDVGAAEQAEPAVRRFPFDPRRRMMSVVTAHAVLTKGAPDAILARCAAGPASAGAEDALETLTGRGFRVLAVARRSWDGPLPTAASHAETDLTLVGLLAFEDPPRPEVRSSLEECRRAGIAVAMITGDHPETARAIADEVGLRPREAPVLVGADLPADDALLGALLDRDGVVVARVSPEDKFRIARALQNRGHVVAMTGDGVNDGPALQAADIGIAMGRSGTDVARDAADLVLLDDHFATIVTAVLHGRATFANIRHFLTYHLTDNVAELTPFLVWALSGGRIPLALTVLQVLALDIGTDTLPAVALGAEPPITGTPHPRPARGRLLDRTVAVRAFGVLGPTEAVVEMCAFLAVFLVAGWRPGEAFPGGDVLLGASGAAFAAVVLGQLANAFACRSSTRWAGAMGWFTNRLLVGAVALELVVAGAFLLVPPVADLLRHQAPPLAGWAVALLAIPSVIGADAAVKRLARRGSGIGAERGPVGAVGAVGAVEAVEAEPPAR
jgi:calcium-translocating P-type ATPase